MLCLAEMIFHADFFKAQSENHTKYIFIKLHEAGDKVQLQILIG